MSGSKYVDTPSAIQLIGCIYRQPSLLDTDGQYFFTEDDFTNDFHKVVFGAAYNLWTMGARSLSIKAVEDYLKDRPASYGIYQAGNGPQWLKQSIEEADLSNFNYYYNRVKKMTLLREFDKIGVNVSEIYDVDNLIDPEKKERQNKYLDDLELNEIADLVEEKVNRIRREYIDNSTDEAVHAADGIESLFESLSQTPDMGLPMYGDYVNTITRGMRLGKFFLRSAASGVGKALPNSTIIPTPSGNKRVEEIKVGDYLFDALGHPTRVLGVYPQGKKEVWEVTFKDGRKAKCCEDHLWSFCTVGQGTKFKLERKFYTKTLKEINQMELFNSSQGNKILIPMQKAVHYPTKNFYIKPYTFGLLLGDGSFRYHSCQKALSYSSADDQLPLAIAKEMNWRYKKNSDFNYSWTFEWIEQKEHKNVWVEEALKDFPSLWQTKSENKFIPQEYLEGDINQRFDLLNGLLDSDGSVDREKGRVSFWTVSPQLKDGVIQLCLSLGFKTSCVTDTHKDSLPLYKVEIMGSPEDKIKLFRLPRKKERILHWYNNGKRKEQNLFNPIINIEKLDYSEEMTCFYVDNKEHLFLMNDFIVTHNTRTMIADFCYCACSEIYENGEWISTGDPQPALFISTELELDELQTMMVAFLSGIDEERILNNTASSWGEERERINHAIELIKNSPMYLEVIPDFSLKDIENTIKRNIRVHKCRYIFLDYIHTSMKILEEISRRSGGIKLREDNVLFLLSVKLKDICNQFGVFILSSTQLNQSWKSDDIPDQNLLRGAKSIADKIDIGSILLDVTAEDREALQSLVGDGRMPNVKLSVYKNRRGSYNKCYLWMHADKSTCRFNGLFCTDYNYEPIAIKDINITMIN